MKVTLSIITICTTATLLAAPTLFADCGRDHENKGGTAASSQTMSGQSSSVADQSRAFFKAHDLIGKTVKGSQGEDLGKLKDIVFNDKQGEVFGILDVGKDRFAPVPWRMLNLTQENGSARLSLNSTKATLQAGPSLSGEKWSNLNDPSFTQSIYSYYKSQPAAMGGTGSGTETIQGEDQQKDKSSQPDSKNSEDNQNSKDTDIQR